MATSYSGMVEEDEVSGFSEYVSFISNSMSQYGETDVVNPAHVQMLVDDDSGKLNPDVRKYFDALADAELLDFTFEGMGIMPNSCSVKDKGRYVFNSDRKKQIGEDYWAAQKGNFVMVIGEDYACEEEYITEDVAEISFQGLNEENVESHLEP